MSQGTSAGKPFQAWRALVSAFVAENKDKLAKSISRKGENKRQ
ncbi:MAG: PaREP1 family protein [Metallosphaera sp.]|nr:PaREP1 family protein [Metallosphaera sedula]MCH1771220.1 PaREP1 family protein [Metallosphaera sedula]MCP6729592.1 PaREP1 family protein [Metallosphaera sedula]